MKEIEIKVRYDRSEREKIVSHCAEQGFLDCGTQRETDRYFTPAHKNILAQDEALRLRHLEPAGDGDAWRVTYKGRNESEALHSRKEIETSAGDGAALLEILERLDFQTVATVEKNRHSFSKDGVTICIDEVTGLGDFLEIEILAEEGEAAQARAEESVMDVLTAIGLSDYIIEKKNYLVLILTQK
jgi:adenylate cyclase class 2